MKKYIFSILVIIGIIILSGCTKSDALKFKEEYESLNGVEVNGKAHRTITIDKNNPFVYSTGDEIVSKVENKETFYLYVGDKQCPWCRSAIEMAIKKANEYGVKTIYYINIWDDDHNEIFRDKYELSEDGKLNRTLNGTEAYNKLLTYFDNVLSDYTLTSSDGKKIETGEKRIYAPNFFYVKDGVVKSFVTGNSDKQTDSRGELTEEILEDEANQFDSLFKAATTCDGKC